MICLKYIANGTIVRAQAALTMWGDKNSKTGSLFSYFG